MHLFCTAAFHYGPFYDCMRMNVCMCVCVCLLDFCDSFKCRWSKDYNNNNNKKKYSQLLIVLVVYIKFLLFFAVVVVVFVVSFVYNLKPEFQLVFVFILLCKVYLTWLALFIFAFVFLSLIQQQHFVILFTLFWLFFFFIYFICILCQIGCNWYIFFLYKILLKKLFFFFGFCFCTSNMDISTYVCISRLVVYVYVCIIIIYYIFSMYKIYKTNITSFIFKLFLLKIMHFEFIL